MAFQASIGKWVDAPGSSNVDGGDVGAGKVRFTRAMTSVEYAEVDLELPARQSGGQERKLLLRSTSIEAGNDVQDSRFHGYGNGVCNLAESIRTNLCFRKLDPVNWVELWFPPYLWSRESSKVAAACQDEFFGFPQNICPLSFRLMPTENSACYKAG